MCVIKITANIATHKTRKESLPKTVESLKNQTFGFDEIRIYANDYTPNIDGIIVQTGNDITDRGKFWWAGKGQEIYFSCDDDLLYPPFYVEYFLNRLNDYPECVLSLHGRKLQGKGLHYYREHRSYRCLSEEPEDKIIDVPGTGVMCYDSRYFNPNVLSYDEDKMTDVLVGLEAAKQGVDVVMLAHSCFWLKGLKAEGSIYRKLVNDCKRQGELCDMVWDMKY